MAKVLFKNDFHGTEFLTTVKDAYADSEGFLTGLECAAYHDRDDVYARRKIAAIKKELCGCAECTCDGFVSETIES